MHLARLVVENFRIYGSELDKKHLDLSIRDGLTVLVGENDSGKTAIVDALRLVLGTTSQDFLRALEDDFHKTAGKSAEYFSIYCRFENLTENESARFVEWLSLEKDKPVLELTYRAALVNRKNRSGVDVPTVEVTNRSGPKGEGRAIDSDIRNYLHLTYLKPLRDAEREMASGRGSRLSQLLLHHQALKGQEETSVLLPAKSGEASEAPKTLRGIMNTTEQWIQKSPAIEAAKNQLNKDYINNLTLGTEQLHGEITIGRTTDLRGVLEKLELWLASEGAVAERTRHGLGLNNLLFMAAELLLLSESAETGLPLLLIEEPEAHLHPQLQLRLMEFLESKVKNVQIVMTTHSPNLSSKANLENLTVTAGGRAYPLSQSQTKLTPNDYRYLRKFLDATKANLFFARSVVMVEGDAENILLPALAKLLGRSFTEYGVSVVKVGTRGLFRFSRILQRQSGEQIPIKVACISDRDLVPNEAAGYTKASDSRLESKVTGEKLTAHLTSLTKHDGAPVKTFVSEKWTLEYDLSFAGLGLELNRAIALAKKMGSSLGEISEEDTKTITTEADKAFAALSKGASVAQIAASVYEPLFKNQASKPEVAQVLAGILEDAAPAPEVLRAKLPPYLIQAIEYVTTPLPEISKK